MGSAHIRKKARLTRASGATGAVTLIPRFGSALDLNVHLHMLVLDGAYVVGTQPPVFRCIAPPRPEELRTVVERIAERIGRALERQGVLARDAESSYFELDPEGGGPMADFLGHSITYRVVVGPPAEQKVFSLQTVPAREDEPREGRAVWNPWASVPAPKAIRMSWARRLERVFEIEIEQCVRCGGRLKAIASIEEP